MNSWGVNVPTRSPVRSPVTAKSELTDLDQHVAAAYQHRYSLDVCIRYNFTANPYQNSLAFTDSREQAEIALARFLFADVREHIEDLRSALLGCDYDSAIKYLDAIEKATE